jgi:hypothetical protein
MIGVPGILALLMVALPGTVLAADEEIQIPDETICLGGTLPAPGIAGEFGVNFGIDGNLLPNSPNVSSPPFNAADDWTNYINSSGTPIQPLTFHPTDLTGNDDLTRFFQGVKFFEDPNDWNWTSGSSPQKDDINNGYLAFVEDDFGDLWALVGGDRRAVNGSSYIDFEFLQNSLTMNGDGTFTSLGPDSGRTVGDLLFTIKLTNGGSQADFFAQRWEPDPDNPGTFNYFELCPGTDAFVAANIESTVVVPWGAFGSTTYQQFAFAEGGINLTALLGDLFDECFGISTLFVRTKSSFSSTSELKDFIEPIQIDLCFDDTPPSLTCPAAITVQCLDDVPDPVPPVATDNCDENPLVEWIGDSPAGSCPTIITRTYRATDGCGNTATCTQSITVDDTIAPEISCPANVTVECLDDVPAPSPPSATDNCDLDVDVVHSGDSDPSGTCPATIVRTYTATDDCGNTATCTQTITVDDTIAPEISCPANVTVECLDDVPAPSPPSATDNCDLDVEVIHVGDSDPSGTCPATIVRTYRATDDCGNISTCTQTITVDDTTPPQLTCPANVTVECLDDVPAPSPPSATDNCDLDVDVVHSGDSPSGTCPTIITRTYTATDDCGNISTCTQTITVDDTIPPQVSCPANVTVQCLDDVPAPSPPSATDNCDLDVDVVHSGDSPSGTCPTIITRTYTATDDCGNTATCTQTITVSDTTPPQITCPADITVQCSIESVPDPVPPPATDNCDDDVEVVWVSDVPTGDCPTVVVRTYRATDDCGNAATCTQSITIDDQTPPEITCPANVTVECLDDVPAPNVQLVQATDDCGTPVVTHEGDTGPTGTCPATIVRTYRATDTCGNTATCTQTITVDDTTPPQLTCPANVTVECLDDVPAPSPPSATDNCDDAVDVVHTGDSDPEGTCPATIVRTYTATDDCGNTATCTQTITVDDTIPPQLSCPANVTVECLDDVPAPSPPSATDNCDLDVDVVHTGDSDPEGTCPATIVRTYTATDDCGNTATCTQTITVDDTTPPQLSCPANVTVECLDDVPAPSPPSATDNCDDAVDVVHSGDSPSGTCPTIITRTYTATDDCGNTATCIQTITVDDTTPPEVTCPEAIRVECGDQIPAPSPPSATDNCDDAVDVVWVSDSDPEEGVCPMVFVRTYQATDDCENTATCTQTITVECCQTHVFCTVTQGFYGNPGGMKCSEFPGGFPGATTTEILEGLVPVTVGKDSRTLTINDAECVLILLPGGGPAAVLPDFGNATVNHYSDIYCDVSNKGPNSLWDAGQIRTKSGRLQNILLAQTLTLALNVKWDSGLGGWLLQESFQTADVDFGALLCDKSDDIVDDDCEPFPSTHSIGSEVYDELVVIYGNPTVDDLLELANCALAGEPVNVSLEAIAEAVAAINEGFDECRGIVRCDVSDLIQRRRNFTELDRDPGFGAIPMQFGLSPNFPNPAQAVTNIRFALPERSQVRLTVYNVQGQAVSVLVDEVMSAGYKDVRLDAQSNKLASGIYLYRLEAQGLDTGKGFNQTRKMLLMR